MTCHIPRVFSQGGPIIIMQDYAPSEIEYWKFAVFTTGVPRTTLPIEDPRLDERRKARNRTSKISDCVVMVIDDKGRVVALIIPEPSCESERFVWYDIDSRCSPFKEVLLEELILFTH